MTRFAAALERQKAPPALGDVSLRYEPSMLIGETAAPAPTSRPTAVGLAGFVMLMASFGLLVSGGEVLPVAGLLILGAALIGGGVWLGRLERRRRRFIVNFATLTLRLDFATPIAGYARTLNVPFDAVKDLAVVDQADGARCLTVEFRVGPQALREVLAAFITPAQADDAERVERVLRGAFGLGTPPADSPAFTFEESSFEP